VSALLRSSILTIALLAHGAQYAVVHGDGLPQWPRYVVWQPPFVGVGLANVTLSYPRPLRIHALRVDLDAEGLSLVTDKSNGDRELEVDGLTTSSFLLQTGCQAAINASAFTPLQKEEGGEQDIRGFVVSNGEVVSHVDDDKPRSAVVICADRRAAMVDPPVDAAGVVTAIGGYGDLLRNGAVIPPNEKQEFIDELHPRTALGIDDGGRTLILVVVDGRQPGYSEGVALDELAEMMRLLGADDAVNLDGRCEARRRISARQSADPRGRSWQGAGFREPFGRQGDAIDAFSTSSLVCLLAITLVGLRN
jgi:hypothetical protein